MVAVRLAHKMGGSGDNCLIGQKGVKQMPKHLAPPLLVSYYYLQPFLKKMNQMVYRDWVLDSGAFSAYNSGVTINLQEYIQTCKQLLANDKTLTEVFALDVIGDHKRSLKNTEEMWRQGVPAVPCFHVGEPDDVLIYLAKNFPKIALGGGVGFRRKDEWAAQCFAKVWPKKIHGFAFGSKKSIMALPWDSVDATNWELGPCKFARWNSFGAMSLRGSSQDVTAEVMFYLELEKAANLKWAGALKQLA